MKICVIGGAGFIGRRVVRLLAGRGHEVVCLDLYPVNHFADLGAKVTLERMDISSFEDVVSALARHKPEAVVNLTYMIGDHPPRTALKVNILGTDNCFEAARLCDIPHVIYASSLGVFAGGQAPFGSRGVRETDTPMPKSQYSVHKVFNEWQAHEYRTKHGMTITCVRVTNVSGVDKVLGSVDHVECIVKPALGQKAIFPYRDRMRCVIHVEDLAEIFARVAVKPKPDHPMYNSGGETLSLGDLAALVQRFIPEADISFNTDIGAKESAEAYIVDNSRVVEEFAITYLPYEQRVPLMIEEARALLRC